MSSRVSSISVPVFLAAGFAASLVGCNAGGGFAPAEPRETPATACEGSSSTLVPAVTAPKRIYQPDWAGPVLFASGQVSMKIPAHRFCAVEGEWVVPFAKPTINCS
ncbi:MAG: hypothetical protein WA742_12065, partial [Candidatus Cybelea sp.]